MPHGSTVALYLLAKPFLGSLHVLKKNYFMKTEWGFRKKAKKDVSQ